MTPASPVFLRTVREDMKVILARFDRPPTWRNAVWATFACDGFTVLMLFRTRQWMRRRHVPVVGRLIRAVETGLYSIELGNDIELGTGVFFMHTVGTVVGSGAKVGDGCTFLGNNTVGAAERPGSPQIGARTIIGAGARVLGKIDVGDDCVLGANAVVVSDVPTGKVALGIPARVSGDNPHRHGSSSS